ncbi:MAG TPA: topoisomerase C-terminal repeat-containing protein, partial [Burkholderiales bacterium]|nr:topoisomerase C-terminal repeat-containing protein [Burkholderiales bacterium]
GLHTDDNRSVAVHNGRYGPYVKHGKTNATIPPSIDPSKITLEEALELLATKTAKAGKPKAGKQRKNAAKIQKDVNSSSTRKAAKPAIGARKKKRVAATGKRKTG